MKNHEIAIVANRLTRSYGDLVAVNAVTFEVLRGEVFGFLGPNGAGKSTTARMLTGVIRPTAGQAIVAGIDMATHPSLARRHFGVVPEEANVYADLSALDNILLMAELHGMPRQLRKERALSLLTRFQMEERATRKGMELSKGFRQRLMLCMALVSAPEILFLDEPTSGLDVASAHLIRDLIAEQNKSLGMTVFLTTHNMQEANQLCDRVAIISDGVLAAIDSPAKLRERIESQRSVEICFENFSGVLADICPALAGIECVRTENGFRIFTAQPGRIAQEIVVAANSKGLHVQSISTQSATLEDVFLAITASARPGVRT
jgi:ABC-2 type transport system ATP-binding protein